MVKNEKKAEEERIKIAVKIVVKNGKKDEILYWENPDLGNMGICPDHLNSISLFTTGYSQVSDGHYYYLRHLTESEYPYCIYRDEGIPVARFYPGGDMESFVTYKNEFYVEFYAGEEELGRINTGQKMDEIYIRSKVSNRIPNMIGYPWWIYDDIYYRTLFESIQYSKIRRLCKKYGKVSEYEE